MSLFLLTLLLLIGGPVASCRITTARRIREIDAVLRDLGDALRKKDYDRARRLCTSDFELWPHDDYWNGANGATDEHLALVIEAVINAPSRKHSVLNRSGRSKEKYLYGPRVSGGFLTGVGRFYEFKKEDGEWKFTGQYGFWVD